MSDEEIVRIEKMDEAAKVWKDSRQGAGRSVWAATAKALECHGGKYLEDCQIAKPWTPDYNATWVYDQKEGLPWKKSLELLKMSDRT